MLISEHSSLPANQAAVGIEVVNEGVFVIGDDDMSFGINRDTEAKLQLLILEGRNEAAGFGEALNLGGFGKAGERPRFGAFGTNNARTNEAVAGFGQSDVGSRAPNVAAVSCQ